MVLWQVSPLVAAESSVSGKLVMKFHEVRGFHSFIRGFLSSDAVFLNTLFTLIYYLILISLLKLIYNLYLKKSYARKGVKICMLGNTRQKNLP